MKIVTARVCFLFLLGEDVNVSTGARMLGPCTPARETVKVQASYRPHIECTRSGVWRHFI